MLSSLFTPWFSESLLGTYKMSGLVGGISSFLRLRGRLLSGKKAHVGLAVILLLPFCFLFFMYSKDQCYTSRFSNTRD